jgi:Protoglobin
MESMHDIARAAIEQMPPECRFRPIDAQVIKRHEETLLALESLAVKGFYDTLYAHPSTAAVFVEGERPDRELTLSNWWRRTVSGPLDDEYFAWMAMVGLVHVIRDVSNPMMLAMADFVATFAADQAAAARLDPADVEELTQAFRRLSGTVGAIISYGYDQAVVAALYNIAGMPAALLRRLRNQEVADALAVARDGMGPRP